jgi:phosphatidylinositol phospholipase C delta
LRERNGRCVEIDVWPSANGPIVTHGYTLSTTVRPSPSRSINPADVAQVPFDSVCAAIGAAVTETDWPVWISLECHVNAEGQPQLVEIMRRAWGDKLVTEHVRTPDGRPVAPRDLKGRILLMVGVANLMSVSRY